MARERTILHVDMDAFFASVEQRDDPRLRGRPLIVGGRSRRGVVAAASYEVRRFGVRSAMSMVEALRRCPSAHVVPPRMERYAETSLRVFDIFRRFTPQVEGLSVDEAFLDVTGSRKLFGDGAAIATKIRAAIRDELALTASAGVAPSKFVAKVASDLDKPDGLVVVRAKEVAGFLAPLPIERMWGVGPKAAARIRAAGFTTLDDLARADEATLRALLGSWGIHAGQLARGEDDREVVVDRAPKSLGAENTFSSDLHSAEELEPHLLSQAARVASRLHRAGLRGHEVTLKVKLHDHRVCTRQRRSDAPIYDTDAIYRTARCLLANLEGIERGVRLTGISVGGFGEIRQTSLFGDPDRDRRERIEAVTAEVRTRFGARGLLRGRLLEGRGEKEEP